MANKGIENLVHFTSDNAAQMGHKGGINSGRTRRFAKTVREAIERESLKKMPTKAGEMVNGMEALASAMYREAIKGNVRAAELIVRLRDEFPALKSELTGAEGKPLVPTNIDLSKLTNEQKEALLSIGEQIINDTEH